MYIGLNPNKNTVGVIRGDTHRELAQEFGGCIHITGSLSHIGVLHPWAALKRPESHTGLRVHLSRTQG